MSNRHDTKSPNATIFQKATTWLHRNKKAIELSQDKSVTGYLQVGGVNGYM
jgi:hypothetical protein